MKKSILLFCIIGVVAVLCSCSFKGLETAIGNSKESGKESGTGSSIAQTEENSKSNIDSPVETPQDRGEHFNAEEYASKISGTWQDAYIDIISDIHRNLPDPYDLISEYDYLNGGWVYVGIHDFDNNDIPELIIGSSVSVAVFTYEEEKAKKVADLYETEEWMALNYLCYKDNHLVLMCCGNGGIDYPGGNGYVCFTYEQGEYITGFYCDYHPNEATINGEPVSGEEFLGQFDVHKLKENSHMEYSKVNVENEIRLAGSDEWIAIDDLDFSLIEW